MPRPGGNPDLKDHQFVSDKEEPCTSLLAVRVSPSDYEKLKAIPNWQEAVREKIKEIIK